MTTIRFTVPVLALAALLTPAAAGHARDPQAAAMAVRAASPWGRSVDVRGLGALGAARSSVVESVSCASPGNCVVGGWYFDAFGRQGFLADERNGVWGRAFEVPGLGALNVGGEVLAVSVSCGSAGNCVAGGDYLNAFGYRQGFVASERRWVWGRAFKVPGLGALSAGRYSAVGSVSCSRAGNCAAGGYYYDAAHHSQGFVAVQRNGVWRRAIEVPGLGALNGGGSAGVNSVSCGSASNCAIGGTYEDAAHNRQGFVAVQRNGVWRRAIEVPGLVALNAGDDAAVNSVSCGSAGGCAAGGSYADSSGHMQGFLAGERNGVWGRALEVPGLGALNVLGEAQVVSVSCGPAGGCAAGGNYNNDSDGFVVSQRNGVWGQALEVPGLGALNPGGFVEVSSVSCLSASDCAVGGFSDDDGGQQGFVAVERNGMWGQAFEVPGLGILNAGGNARVGSVSCASAGNCVVGGSFTSRSGAFQGFVAIQRNGVWGQAFELPGPGALRTGGTGQVLSVSCGSEGSCAAGGSYTDSSGHAQGFLADERREVWRRAIEVPGLGALNARGNAQVASVSCASPDNCAAGGDYTDSSGHVQGYVADQRNGTWRRALEVPGLGMLNAGGNAQILSVSCSSAGNCAAGGDYTDASRNVQGFVAAERNGVWRRAIAVPGLGTLNAEGAAAVGSVSCASAGNCAAGGYYSHLVVPNYGFVAAERNGVWRRAIGVPGLRAFRLFNAAVVSVSCGSAGNCAAGGSFTSGGYISHGFVATERNGVWRRAFEVHGLGALSVAVNSVSCGSAGNCAAGGNYIDRRGHGQGFVVSERNGVWHRPLEVPGLRALNVVVNSVSCASAGNCAAGGWYLDPSGHSQGFLVSERNGVWRRAFEVPGLGALNSDGDVPDVSVSCGSADNCAAGGNYRDASGAFQAFLAGERHGAWGRAFEVPGLRTLEHGQVP